MRYAEIEIPNALLYANLSRIDIEVVRTIWRDYNFIDRTWRDFDVIVVD